MLRFTGRRLFFDKLSNTKLGAEVLSSTREEMRHMEKTDNIIMRFFTRRRPIDYLAIEVDGPITKELASSFVYVKHAFTALLCLPVFALALTGLLSPTYYLLVPTRIMPAEKYEKMWDFANPFAVFFGQVVFCLLFYDFSVYVRYPFFAKVLAPLYRSQGWLRPLPKASYSVEQLKSGAAMRGLGASGPRPLGRPLGEVRKEMKATAKPNPFGKPSAATGTASSAAAARRPQRDTKQRS